MKNATWMFVYLIHIVVSHSQQSKKPCKYKSSKEVPLGMAAMVLDPYLRLVCGSTRTREKTS
jgi:hypothetical protein